MEKRKRKKKELFKTEIEDAVPSCFRCLRIFAGTGSDDRGSGDFPWTYSLISWRHTNQKKNNMAEKTIRYDTDGKVLDARFHTTQDHLSDQDLRKLDITSLNPLSPEVRQSSLLFFFYPLRFVSSRYLMLKRKKTFAIAYDNLKETWIGEAMA